MGFIFLIGITIIFYLVDSIVKSLVKKFGLDWLDQLLGTLIMFVIFWVIICCIIF